MEPLNIFFLMPARELLPKTSTMPVLLLFFSLFLLLPALWAMTIICIFPGYELRKQKPFPLMKLPAEVRLLVFDHLIDAQLTKPKIVKRIKQQKEHAMRRLLRRQLHPVPMSLLSSLTLVNRQIRDEFFLVFCQKSTFSFTLDASNTENDPFWKLSPRILSSIRNCQLNVLASPGISGAFDPRQASGSWVVRDRVVQMLEKMQNLVDVELSIQACGNQLWNPIWLWHYTSQSFKQVSLAGFSRIRFNLDAKMREPNHLSSQGAGPWHWRCSAGHNVMSDPLDRQPIRQFCDALYADCHICDPPAQLP